MTIRLIDGVPWVNDRSFPWAASIRSYEHEVNGDIYWYRGFHLVFENGWTLSVQWGWGNYCRNYLRSLFAPGVEPIVEESPDAEIACWDKDDNWLEHDTGDIVLGYVTADDLLDWIERVAAFPSSMLTTTEPTTTPTTTGTLGPLTTEGDDRA